MLKACGTALTKSLSACRLFRGMTEAELSKLTQQAVVERYQAGDILFRQDDAAERFFAVLEGRVVLYLDREGDPSGVARIAGPGETFAEACICGLGSYFVTAEALGANDRGRYRAGAAPRAARATARSCWRVTSE